MNKSEYIEIKINRLKELNQEAGHLLHTQLHHASNSQWSKDELSELIKSENDAVDLLDSELLAFEEMQEKAREIQDDIIQTFAE